IAIPNEQAALEATKLARSLNPTTRIVTRCHFTSKGLEAKMHGADDVIVEEQVVARELVSMLEPAFIVAKGGSEARS
ncbi:MAG TPA: NAD-binding protein, partial [Tepidisphaeraceae bacterium]|nr:NAD-binding protein [Tepidisphaeraceae bacterium]